MTMLLMYSSEKLKTSHARNYLLREILVSVYFAVPATATQPYERHFHRHEPMALHDVCLCIHLL
jgi:hypothetical protein